MNKEQKDIYILGIESSCDETAAAVVKNGREVLSNIISSQIVIHRKFGGVVPEIASRKHIENVMPVIDEAQARTIALSTLSVRHSNARNLRLACHQPKACIADELACNLHSEIGR